MSGLHPYEYVVLRCVPRVDREEFVNIGVVLHCRAADMLSLRWQLDEQRLQALWPGLDPASVHHALAYLDAVAAGEERGGAAAGQPISTRFGFLKAPRSTVVQPGPVHSGLCTDPAAEVERLLARLVAPIEQPQSDRIDDRIDGRAEDQTGTSSTAPTA